MVQSPTITVFGSGTCPPGSDLYQTARTLGRLIAQRGWQLCNGGYGGSMQAAAEGAREAGGTVVGVTCRALGRAGPNPFVTREIPTDTLLERLETLLHLANAFVVLPGGTGTLLELSAVWELTNKALLPARPVVVWHEPWREVVAAVRGVQGDGVALEFVGTPDEAVRLLASRLGA